MQVIVSATDKDGNTKNPNSGLVTGKDGDAVKVAVTCDINFLPASTMLPLSGTKTLQGSATMAYDGG